METIRDDVLNRPVVSSLFPLSSATNSSPPSRSGTGTASSGSGTQPHRSHPFSSISLSPQSNYAVASGKDVLHVLRLNLKKHSARRTLDKSVNCLEEIRSGRIAQTAGGTPGVQNPQYPHLRDALRLPGAAHPGSASIPTPSAGGGGGININVTDVSWSLPQTYVVDNGGGGDGNGNVAAGTHGGSENAGLGDSYEVLLSSTDVHDSEHYCSHDQHYPSSIKRTFVRGSEHSSFPPALPHFDDTSVVAAAGSNGVVVAWNARDLVGDLSSSVEKNSAGGPGGLFHARKSNVRVSQVSPAASMGQPEAAFLAHSRAVNRLSWHPTGRRPYLLLTASQDGSVKLWDRRATSSSSATESRGVENVPVVESSFNLSAKSWFGFGTPSVTNAQLPPSNAMAMTAIWHCISTYLPKCEAVRDIKWNPFMDDVFALVAGEWLCVYDIRVNKPMMKESTHAGDATCVDWHPTRKYTIATGGGRDRSVKVWDLESSLNIHKRDDASTNLKTNSGSYDNSETLSATSHTSSEGPVSILNDLGGRNMKQGGSDAHLPGGSVSPMKRTLSGAGLSHLRHHKKKLPLYVLNSLAPVTTIRWRPPVDASDVQCNHHESMIAVATSSIYGANAGGNGSVGLWSCHRPFMPISVCEGHLDGAVADFSWIVEQNSNRYGKIEPDTSSLAVAGYSSYGYKKSKMSREKTLDRSGFSNEGKQPTEVPALNSDIGRASKATVQPLIVTVGRDGNCLLQNFAFGRKPINTVPRATFALANLSPFQPGFGSLQIMAVHQNVSAPAIVGREKYDAQTPNELPKQVVFSITDGGDVEDLSKDLSKANVDVAPELTHLSRLSELYVTKTGIHSSRAAVCRHNATVAESLNRKEIAQMWKTLALILDGSGLDGLPNNPSDSNSNPLAYACMRTLENLLMQRANAGDVQSCVVLCEVMDAVVPPGTVGGTAKSRLPNINISLVREWYLTYIDLLQQMCLFTQASDLVRDCCDPVVGALNQQSTTIHESCPRCGKPLLGGTTIQDNSGTTSQLSAQRVCRSCRSRIGFCFICHEPVKGLFVWCPGCGHGGHLEHALEWFGFNEFCPTGCGHRCNLQFHSTTCNRV
ncbi:hypothetical protein ACHAWF_015240 [Thalassiosira exigua]